jgi:hypothetical protein
VQRLRAAQIALDVEDPSQPHLLKDETKIGSFSSGQRAPQLYQCDTIVSQHTLLLQSDVGDRSIFGQNDNLERRHDQVHYWYQIHRARALVPLPHNQKREKQISRNPSGRRDFQEKSKISVHEPAACS